MSLESLMHCRKRSFIPWSMSFAYSKPDIKNGKVKKVGSFKVTPPRRMNLRESAFCRQENQPVIAFNIAYREIKRNTMQKDNISRLKHFQ